MTTTQTKINSGWGAQSTADDVLAGRSLSGQVAVVTGGYSGLGLEIARALTRAGASVIVPARRVPEAKAALADVPGATVVPLDLADLTSVERCGEGLLATTKRVDMLIAAAGIMACPESRVGAGWESHFAVNHLGHFALVNRLAPLLQDGARVVSMTSSGHFLSAIRWDDLHFDRGYDRWAAYGQSKTANALFALHLDRLGAERGLHAFSAHPGSILTPLQRHIPRDEQIELGWIGEDGEPAEGFKTPEQGGATATWAATEPRLAEHGGAYCQDCDIAEPAKGDDMLNGGVKPWAIDADQAARLWDLSANLTGVDAFN